MSQVRARQQSLLTATCVAVAVFSAGCGTRSTSTSQGGNSRVEHYVSPRVEGETARINLDEVQKAFFETQGKDFNSWMSAFEKRVNEIYDGKEIISIDATREQGHLVVTGYIDSQKAEGYKPGDEKLFTIEQTGDAVNNEMPYRVTQNNGQVYYEGRHSILDNPFLQMMLISHLIGGFSGRYYTPYDRVVVLDNYRTSYRATPQYQAQTASNSGFFSRFKQKSTGGLTSSKGFGATGFSSTQTTRSRSWSAGTGSSGTSTRLTTTTSTSSGGSSFGSSWGGRRSSGSFSSSRSSFGGFGGFKSRGWGGRRR